MEKSKSDSEEGGSRHISKEREVERELGNTIREREAGGEEVTNHAEGVAEGALEAKDVEKTVERGYLKCIPERMNEKEYEWELKKVGEEKETSF